MVTIGVDARALSTNAGRGRILKEMLPRIIERLDGDTLVLYGGPQDRLPELPAGRWRFSRPGRRGWHAAMARRASASCDVLFSANTYISPLFATIPSATLICDLVAFHAFAQAHPRARINERLTLPLAVRRCRRLLCISQSTRRDLVARYPAAAEKARVVQLAGGSAFAAEPGAAELAAVRGAHELPEEFILCVGTIEPRKNLPRLIEAHNRLDSALRERFPLILVGEQGWSPGPFAQALAGARGTVRVLGFVGDAELSALYRLATVVAYPSLYEGFGLPVLEALGAGAAVLTSSSSSLPEIAADAALLVDPADVEAIAAGLAKLLESPALRAELAARGPARAAAFSWETGASQVLGELRSIAAG